VQRGFPLSIAFIYSSGIGLNQPPDQVQITGCSRVMYFPAPPCRQEEQKGHRCHHYFFPTTHQNSGKAYQKKLWGSMRIVLTLHIRFLINSAPTQKDTVMQRMSVAARRRCARLQILLDAV
jgi:hypothetical protein